MKKIVPFILLMLCLASCASSRSAEQKMQEATKVESQIADSVQNHSFTVTFNYVNSARFPITYLTSTYSLKMTGDSISSCLPYFGRAYEADYGSTDSPLSFNGHADNVKITRQKGNSYLIKFRTRNKLENFKYYLTIYNNGKASLNISSSAREPISFDGEMELK